MIRDFNDPLYTKAINGTAFFFPGGGAFAGASIWDARPLAEEYVQYAASDVVVLFLLRNDSRDPSLDSTTG